MEKKLTKAELKEKRKKLLALQRKYGTRITTARKARESFAAKNYVQATRLYQDYLVTLAELKEVTDIYKLAPNHFDDKREITEMLLISHVYWDLARINEMTPKLQSAFNLSLNQFIKFTINQPYQVLNAEMLRRYIKRNKGRSPQTGALNSAYNQIFIQSNKCYVATLCFGENHRITESLRVFKAVLSKTKYGLKFIEIYYRISSPLVSFLENKKMMAGIFRFIVAPPLALFAKIIDLKEKSS